MINDILLGLGFVAVIEGLVLALAPSRLEDIVELLRKVGPDRIRMFGLCTLAFGVLLVWLARG
jgi:hypothetical protein